MKKLLNIGLLSIVFLLVTINNVHAQGDVLNPFITIDKEYEERLRIAKDKSDEDMNILKALSSEELNRLETNILQKSGNRYIVKFREDASMQQMFELVSLYKYEVLGRSENRMFVLELNDSQSFQLELEDMIEFIEEDSIKEGSIIPSDPYYSYQWAIPAINIPKAWEITKGSNSVCIAVIDSGIYRTHPDLINADIRQGWDYIFNGYCDWDSNGHGTNVTGIIGAETNNYRGIACVNWDVAIIPLRVLSYDGTGYVSDTIEAIYDAADIGCDVINISLGSSSYSYAEDLAVSYAISKGSIVVASAGNDGDASYTYPASYDGVISVGSIDRNLSVSSFSQRNNKVDVTAPGEFVFTTSYWYKDINYSDYAYVSGTSFSAPYVSGIAALMSAVKPSITAEEFMEKIKLTSTDLGNVGYDNYYGYGLINAEKMLKSVATIKVEAVSLNKVNTTLNIGESEKLVATILPSNASNKNVTWKSGNPLVATVNNGTITAVGIGTTTIAVTTQDGGKMASILVEVNTPTIENKLVWDLFENVELDKVWTIKFNLKLDLSSWEDNIKMFDSNNNEFPIHISKNSEGESLVVTPLKNYNYNSRYTIVINNNLVSDTGAKLKNDVHIPFITIGE